jgi:hypothetical protein
MLLWFKVYYSERDIYLPKNTAFKVQNEEKKNF